MIFNFYGYILEKLGCEKEYRYDKTERDSTLNFILRHILGGLSIFALILFFCGRSNEC